jgi:hypothetical protein
VRWTLGVYAASRLLYMAIALLDIPLRGWHLSWEVSNWDGFWYLLLVATGYPTHIVHSQSTLGFFPLYPLLIYALQHALAISPVLAGWLLATLFGAIATIVVGRLCERWWGPAAGRRCVLALCLFPGSIVFSMLYTEGLLIAAAAGSLLALEHRRWLRAGLLGAVATATGPAAVAIIPAAVAAAALDWHRSLRAGRRPRATPLLAPLLSAAGIGSFALFLWLWTGTPLASFTAQRYAWHESTTPLALFYTARDLVREIATAPSLTHSGINLNYIAALLGAAFMLGGLVLLWRRRHTVPWPALVWTLGVTLLAVTSARTPPNPRMLIIAFPIVVAYADRFRGKAFRRLLGASTLMLVGMSLVTFMGTGLRP